MKKLTSLFLSGILLAACTSCSIGRKNPDDMEPQISQMKSICELAVMDCYYHNVAKYEEEDASGFLLWKKDKHFWIEYNGIVALGIDASLVSMEIAEDTVTITIPEAKVLDCTVDSASLTEESFIVDKKSAEVDAEDERYAFAEAQSRMEESAAGDRILLSNAQQRAKTLLENYVKNIGNAIGKTYSIQWKFVDAGGNQTEPMANEPVSEPEAAKEK